MDPHRPGPSTDCMAFGPHPDDIELGCAGTLIKMSRAGATVTLVDLTEGELSTRGTVEDRRVEAEAAGVLMGADRRVNLGLPDGDIHATPQAKAAVIRVIRAHRPRLILVPHGQDRHPDHVGASLLVYEAAFAAGLVRIQDGLEPWRPERVVYYSLWDDFEPTFVVDISQVYQDKMNAIRAYRTQFDASDTRYGKTRLTSDEFAARLAARASYYGSRIGREYGEPFLVRGHLEMSDPLEARFFTF